MAAKISEWKQKQDNAISPTYFLIIKHIAPNIY